MLLSNILPFLVCIYLICISKRPPKSVETTIKKSNLAKGLLLKEGQNHGNCTEDMFRSFDNNKSTIMPQNLVTFTTGQFGGKQFQIGELLYHWHQNVFHFRISDILVYFHEGG